MFKINLFDKISFLLVIIGAIAWGFIGLLNINIIPALIGQFLARIIYILVFISALNLIFVVLKCKHTLKH